MNPNTVRQKIKDSRKERKDLAKAQLYIAAQATGVLAAWANSTIGRLFLSHSSK